MLSLQAAPLVQRKVLKMSNTQDHAAIAQILVKGVPLSYKFYPDGSLVVIALSGQKLRFTAEQVRAAEKALKTPARRRSSPPKSSTIAPKSAPRRRKRAQPTPRTESEEK